MRNNRHRRIIRDDKTSRRHKISLDQSYFGQRTMIRGVSFMHSIFPTQFTTQGNGGPLQVCIDKRIRPIASSRVTRHGMTLAYLVERVYLIKER